MNLSQPFMVKSHDIHLDSEYRKCIVELKQRYKAAQRKAAVKVNSEQLLFNWMLGRDLVIRKAEEQWGTGIVEQVSLDLQAEFPNVKGFSVRNLWNMKKWYSFYASDTNNWEKINGLQIETSIRQEKLHQTGAEISEEKLHQTGAELSFPSLFAYVPWRHHVEIVAGKTRRIDLLFYHIRLRCYVVVELKVSAFEPEYAGKLNFYVSAVDELLKTGEDNPSIGLLICKDLDRTEVQWAFRNIQTPMGVSTYNNIQTEEIMDMLPTVDQIKERVSQAQEEFEYRNKSQTKVIGNE